MTDNLLTVTELNDYLKLAFESNPFLADIYVRGEISNFTNHQRTGHFYFSLKDESGTVRAVMFRTYAGRVRFLPENGMKVILHGRVSVFPRDGQYQIYADDMQPDGLGALHLAFEQLKAKLAAEGLFDSARKRQLPLYPTRIGVITSPTGAAVHDIISILTRRYPAAEILLYPALVQGTSAPESLAAGIRFFHEKMPADLLIIGRGGGSTEDLWGFNSEMLARTVAASEIPVISAVGHETDFTICDFVADLRAPTPSAAAELAVPDSGELRIVLDARARQMEAALSAQINLGRRALQALAAARVMRSPLHYVEDRRMALGHTEERLDIAFMQYITKEKSRFAALCGKMDSLNPLAVLSRGYAAVLDDDRHAVCSVRALSEGENITVCFADGEASATVTSTRESESL
ncbi:MAG: exodeoxyribonuclease VII large subunit [Clostridia bacterium]|nr:exodeoxyribonuclease VII large subunit [Clostridia bacterium]